MTTYTYETIPQKKGERVKCYDIQQSIKDDALTSHPETGEPIRRVVTGGFGYTRKIESGGGGGGMDDHHDHDHHHHH